MMITINTIFKAVLVISIILLAGLILKTGLATGAVITAPYGSCSCFGKSQLRHNEAINSGPY